MKTYDVKTYSEACELTRRFFPWLEDLVLYAVEVQP
jgi:hypothetical protein